MSAMKRAEGAGGQEPVRPVDPVDEEATATATVDSRGLVTGWNEGARRLLGHPPSEVVGRPAADLLAGAPAARAAEHFGSLPRWSGPVTLRHRDGRDVVATVLAHRREAGGGGTEWVLVCPVARPSRPPRDDSLVTWGMVQAPCAMALYDAGLRLWWANARMEAVVGLPQEVMRGLRICEIVLDPQAGVTEQRMRTVLETGKAQDVQVPVHLSGQARARVWATSLAPVRDAGGRMRGVILAAHEVTEGHRARQRLALVNDASVRIGSTLDLARTAQELADVAVPQLADFVTVDLLPEIEDDDDLPTGAPPSPVMLRRVASRSVLPGCPEAVLEHGAVAAYPDRSPAAECLAIGRPVIREVNPGIVERWADQHPERAERVRRFGIHSVLAVPIRARGITLGAAVFSRHRNPQPYEQDDLLLGQEISARAAVCIDNARRFSRERRVSLTLQRSLLPQGSSRQNAVEVASRYLPASAEAGVGGDWFDVIALSGARVGLVVGDVVGHGIQASATMGRLRMAVRTLADIDLPPDELLTHLDDLVNRLSAEAEDAGGTDGDIGATCLYAVYDPVSRHCTMARAGHPAPVLATPDGAVEFLDLPAGPPLGLGGLPFEASDRILPEGSLLVLYTDGLVEARGHDIEDGTDVLRKVLGGQDPTPEGTCDAVFRALLPHHPADDVALLVARTRAVDESQVATWTVPQDPEAVAGIRQDVCRQLTAWNLHHLLFSGELIVSELVTNAIRYGRPPARLRLVKDRTLICEVSDAGSTSPHLRRARVFDEGGRGLLLVAQLAQSWGTRPAGGGKTIWAELALRP